MRILLRNGRVHDSGAIADGLPVLADATDLPELRRLLAGGRTIHDRESA